MEGTPLRPSDLIYPGKRVLLWPSRTEAIALSVKGRELHLRSAEPLSGAELMVNFLGQRYRSAVIVSRIGHDTWSAEVEERFEEFNLRDNPRITVSLPATYYLRPPTHGVPIRVIDLALGGLAISPPEDRASPGDTKLISFQVGTRMIKLVTKVVTCEATRWRMQVTQISAGDEDAIAAWLLALQTGGRRLLPPSDLEQQSSMDLDSRLRFPLITRTSLGHDRFSFGTDSESISFAVDNLDRSDLGQLMTRSANLRLASFADANHLLKSCGIKVDTRDRFITSYIAIAARTKGISPAEVIASTMDLPFAARSNVSPATPEAATTPESFRLHDGLITGPKGTAFKPAYSTRLVVAFRFGNPSIAEGDFVGLIENLASDNGGDQCAIVPTHDSQYLEPPAIAAITCLADLFANVVTVFPPS